MTEALENSTLMTSELAEAIEQVFDAIVEVVKQVCEAIKRVFCEAIKRVWKQICKTFHALWESPLTAISGNRRVAHLAFHAKKERTRKKNLKRLWRIVIQRLKE